MEKTIVISKDYTDKPGGRYIVEGPFSGEDFRIKMLLPKFEEAVKDDSKLVIVLDGGYGYDGSGKPVTVTFSNNFESLLPVFFDDPEITLDTIRGNICYYKNGDKTAEPSEDAIAIAGTHTAELSFKGQTAGVTYTIAKADPTCTAPTGLTATYGDTLADVTLPTGWSWANDTQSVGAVGTNTFKATFTPEDTDNYNVLENLDVTVTVNHIPGDIDGDGEINNKDLTRLFQYLSDWDVEVNEAALDVNGDGSVNNKDLTRLFQYLSDWDVEIY